MVAEGDSTMKALSLDVELTWSGTGLQGVGQIQTDDVAPDLSGPESMGGRGVGTNPEGLFVCAVSSCYTATLFAVPRRVQLPVASLAVTARTTVMGFLAATRFARLVVTPTWRRHRASGRVHASGARSLLHRPHPRPSGRATCRCEETVRVRQTSASRFRALSAKPEVGIQFGAGGATSPEELEQEGTCAVGCATDLARRCLDVGAYMIMIESEGITKAVVSWRTNVVATIAHELAYGP
jgi:peroxiredoxin-like protein